LKRTAAPAATARKKVARKSAPRRGQPRRPEDAGGAEIPTGGQGPGPAAQDAQEASDGAGA